MKILFSPIGLILIVLILAFLFFPRRTPDAIKKRMGKPMRAFPQDEPSADEAGEGTGKGSSAGSKSGQRGASGPT